MISSRIIDNDMGAVGKVPLTGRGTVHGITIRLNNRTLPEFEVGLTEVLAQDMALPRFESHAEEHINDAAIEKEFIQSYKEWAMPVNKSGIGNKSLDK